MPGFKRSKKKNKDKKPIRARIRSYWRIFKVIFILGVIVTIGFAYYFRHLDRLIEAQFDKPRKWDLPSRIFSDAEYLYPGIDISKRKIIDKLDRLGYRNTGENIKGPGDYSFNNIQLNVFLHDFEYPLEEFKGFPVKIGLKNEKITSLVDLRNNEELSLVKLEPEEISSVFDEKMEDRTVVSLKDVPPLLLESIILIEDERFFKHKGIDPIGILRAAFVNLKALRIVEGGSTLTQQLVKNYFLHSGKSFLRKFQEQLMAIQIERKHSKAEILEAYINEIYLGQRGASSISGVAEAAKYFFAKNVDQLTVPESALLAGMIKSPYLYNPRINQERAVKRRNFVLKRLFEVGLIDNEEYKKAIQVIIVTPKVTKRAGRAPYFIDFVKKQLADLYPEAVLQTEGLKIFTTLDMTMQLVAEDSLINGLKNLEEKYKKLLPENHKDPLQGALIAIQPNNGYLRALVGGRDYSESQFNRAIQAKRQPGSAIKPFVYLTALDMRRSDKFFTPASIIDDTSFTIESGGKKWTPKNYDKKEHGFVTIRTALEKSYNIVASKLAMDAGLKNVIKTAEDAGIKSNINAVPSLALGAFEVIPMELAAAYTVFPNGGILAEPISIMNVVTSNKKIVEKKNIKMKRVFDSAPVYLTTNLMKGVVNNGTAAAARAWGFHDVAAGKTGTTSDYKDAWFVGFTPNFLSLTWIGYDDNTSTNMSGSRAALPVWTDFMKKIAPDVAGDFNVPSGIVFFKVDSKSGLLSSDKCPEYIEESFIEGTEPKEYCTGKDNDVREENKLDYY